MIQINFKENYILFSYPDGKYYGYKTGTIRHEIEGSAISFFLLDNEVGEQPVLNFNYQNCIIEGVQATEENINDLLSVIYNGVTTDVKVISFTLDSDKNELKIENNDDTYYIVSLSKYDFTGDITNLLTLINNEVERAKIAEKVNSDAIITEKERAIAVEKSLDTSIVTEVTRATEAEQVLNNKIDTEVSAESNRAKAEETRIEAKAEELVNNETERAIAAESELKTKIETEVKSESDRAHEAEAELNTKIENEVTRATAAEQANTDTISALDTAYKAADTILNTKIDNLVAAEVSRAKAAEKVNADAIITEKERATSTENVIRNGLNDEVGRAHGAETVLDTKIETEVTRSKAEETRIETKFDGFVSTLDSKINTNKTAIETEVERATTAETLIDTKIDAEVTRAKDAEKINSDSITNEVVRAKAAEKVIADDLNAEIIRAKAAEKANNDTINAEAERAKAAEDNIDGKLTIEVARATKAEEDFAALLAGTSGATSYSNIKTELDKLGDDYNSIRSIAVTLKNFLNAGGITDAVDSFKELQDFLAGITDSQTLAGLLLELKNEILGGAGDDINTLKKVYDVLSGNTGGDVDLSNYYTKSEVDAKGNTKVDKVSGKGLSTNDFTTTEKSKLASLSNYDDTELRSLIGNTYTKSEVDAKIDEAVAGGDVDLSNYYTKSETDSKVSNKVDKVTGKGLSTNDYTTAEKTKLAGLTNYDDSGIRTLITNIQNQVEYTLVEKTVSAAGVLNLSNDRLQHSVITRNTTIALPVVSKYTVIDLSFTVNSTYTVTFPANLIWKSAPTNFTDGVEIEVIFTYNNSKWFAACIEYGNN